MDKELKEILDKYSGKEHYGYEDAKKDLLNLFNASGCFSSGESEDLEDAMKIFEKEEEIKEYWIVIDNSTNKALYGLHGKTLTFNSKEEADNFGKQICLSFTSVSIKS